MIAQRCGLACVMMLAVASTAAAQASADNSKPGIERQEPAGPRSTPQHTGFKALVKDLVGDVRALPSRENAMWAGAGGGFALAAHPFDDNVNAALIGSTRAEDFFRAGNILGRAVVLYPAAGTVYAFGRIRDQPRVSHVGMDLIQALLVSEGLTQLLKVATQRERPDHSSHNSFPSGHASDTFAFATALERHVHWRAAVPAYIFSSYVAISRLPANRHWLSDTVFGATVGIIAGRTATRHGSTFPVVIAPASHGVYVGYVRR